MITIRDAEYREELSRLTPNLRRFARALVQDHCVENADDLVQAALVQALATQERRGIRLHVSLLSTLVGLNRAQAQELKADRLTVRSGTTQNAAAREPQWNVARARGPREATALGSMPLECREVLLLVALEGLTYAQAAEVLGLSLNAVIGRLARARDYLGQAGAAAPVKTAPAALRKREPVAYLRLVK